jgi:copper chaperone
MQKYDIKGMTCGHCVRAVEKALAKVPGVSQVRGVDLERGEALLEGAPDEQAVIAAVRGQGYEATRAG